MTGPNQPLCSNFVNAKLVLILFGKKCEHAVKFATVYKFAIALNARRCLRSIKNTAYMCAALTKLVHYYTDCL